MKNQLVMVAKILARGWLKLTVMVLAMVIFGAAVTSTLVANIRKEQTRRRPKLILEQPQTEQSPLELPLAISVESTSKQPTQSQSSQSQASPPTPQPSPSLSANASSSSEATQSSANQNSQSTTAQPTLQPTPPPSTPAQETPKPKQLNRNYPNFIKCSWVPGALLSQAADQLDQIKKLGINTVCIMVPLAQFDDRLPIIGESRIIEETNSALAKIKQANLAIFLVPDAPGSSGETWDKLGKTTPSEFLDLAEQEALKWAAVAEKNLVEYFAPQNELSSRLDGPPTWFGDTEVEKSRRVKMSNDWHAKILPKIRAVFGGKVVAKFGSPETGTSATGYDYTGLTVGHGLLTDVTQFRVKVKNDYQLTGEIAREANNDWLVTELYLPYEEQSGGDVSQEYLKRKAILKDLQDDYFRVTIEEFQSLPVNSRPRGYMPVGYGPGTFSTLDQAAFNVIQNFFW